MCLHGWQRTPTYCLMVEVCWIYVRMYVPQLQSQLNVGLLSYMYVCASDTFYPHLLCHNKNADICISESIVMFSQLET